MTFAEINPLFWAGFILCEALKEYSLFSLISLLYYRTHPRASVLHLESHQTDGRKHTKAEGREWAAVV